MRVSKYLTNVNEALTGAYDIHPHYRVTVRRTYRQLRERDISRGMARHFVTQLLNAGVESEWHRNRQAQR